MIRTLVALLAAALLVAGCGGDDDNADGGDAATTPTAETAPGGGSATTGDEGAGGETEAEPGATEPSEEQLEEAAKACKENLANAEQLSEDAKEDLERLCDEVGSGDPDELRELSREICRRIVSDTLPEGAQREQALRLCDQTEQ